jgi:quercetin dioxygenase-like cupin family protein
MIKAYKLYTGPDGHSHVISGSVAEELFHEVHALRFKVTPPHGEYDWHTAPTTQYVLCLSGTLEFECHSGLKFILQPGEVLIAMDTTGTGHKWNLIDDQPWKRAYVLFKEGTEVNFWPD